MPDLITGAHKSREIFLAVGRRGSQRDLKREGFSRVLLASEMEESMSQGVWVAFRSSQHPLA